MVPLWLFLLIVIPLALALLALGFLHFVANPLPFPDWGNAIFVCPDKTARYAVMYALRKLGIRPDLRIDSRLASRAFYMRRFRFIINVPENDFDKSFETQADQSWARDWQEMLNKFVDIKAALAIVVPNPHLAAGATHCRLNECGYEGNVILDPDPDLERGAMAILTSEAMPRWGIVFRKHFIKMGPKPPKWQNK